MADLTLGAPLPGVVTALADVPDEVFATAMIGPGVAVRPSAADAPAGAAGRLDVVAPCAGTLVKVHPHAVALEAAGGVGVLVHLGIDTVGLGGEGFEVLVADGDAVVAGQTLLRWDTTVALAAGLSVLSPLVVIQGGDEVFTLVEPGTVVAPGDPLLRVTA
ncbi:PTS sugar transporter subunit IIA [Serinibacter arcticus]|uniref:PTS system, N-acetylglucosamine-specific IIA component n=1 Tax=Serinibacter arcticus TaxID=1655435 RepID=A0A4Z1E208_9MICO|nr:PTS glucose transporter subunit IIA [Serinibacter arcticus]TGO06015.1 PTS system, N-acetylglucosamine-specific IIA component [Serinibacter arcticus]